jgi:excisionase family DNA binding protein
MKPGLTIDELAAQLGRSRRAVEDLIYRRRLRTVKFFAASTSRIPRSRSGSTR